MPTVTFDSFANVIDGKLVSTPETRHGINPATKENLFPVPVSTRGTVDTAVAAAKRASAAWSAIPWSERQQCLIRLADAIEAQTEDFAKMLTLEQGKPLSVAKGEVGQCVKLLKGAAEMHLDEHVVEETEDRRVVTRYVPIGVCVGIIPWNFPLALTAFKLGPALLSGNTLILKPSPFTPYAGLKVTELAQQFFPPGVLQALSGDDSLGQWLTEHPDVDKVAFTGSTGTGIKVMQSCAKTLKRVTLELGGNDPAIICPDVDIGKVAPKIALLALFNSGQVCVAIKRIYVHSSIYDEFVKTMSTTVKSFTVGDGMDKSSVLGPVQNAMQYAKLQELVASIKSENLTLSLGDLEQTFSNKKGYYVNPVIVDNPPDNSKIVTEEPFGPVFPVLKWDTEDEVILRANNSDAGLGASVWTNDLAKADRIARQLQTGNVWINCHMELQANATFSGHKKSGLGTELGIEGLKSYCNLQTVHLRSKI